MPFLVIAFLLIAMIYAAFCILKDSIVNVYRSIKKKEKLELKSIEVLIVFVTFLVVAGIISQMFI